MLNLDFICVDYQYDFVHPNGLNFCKGLSVNFINDELIPYLYNNRIKVSEIISDYRLPRGKSTNESCVPGTNGFNSLLPNKIRKGKQWIKCMHNPIWVRENIGIINTKLGEIYQNPNAFSDWLNENINSKNVVLFGETAECCLLQVASELYFRGYNVYILYEATDPMNERLEYKDLIMYHSSISIYAKTINFVQLKEMLEEK